MKQNSVDFNKIIEIKNLGVHYGNFQNLTLEEKITVMEQLLKETPLFIIYVVFQKIKKWSLQNLRFTKTMVPKAAFWNESSAKEFVNKDQENLSIHSLEYRFFLPNLHCSDDVVVKEYLKKIPNVPKYLVAFNEIHRKGNAESITCEHEYFGWRFDIEYIPMHLDEYKPGCSTLKLEIKDKPPYLDSGLVNNVKKIIEKYQQLFSL